MQKILSALLACALALGLLGTVPVGKAAEPKLTLEKEHLLAFSKAPLRIEKVEALPNGNLAVLYFSKGEGPEEESYWLDVFSSAGEHLLSKKLASFIPGGPNYPRAQLLIKEINLFAKPIQMSPAWRCATALCIPLKGSSCRAIKKAP